MDHSPWVVPIAIAIGTPLILFLLRQLGRTKSFAAEPPEVGIRPLADEETKKIERAWGWLCFLFFVTTGGISYEVLLVFTKIFFSFKPFGDEALLPPAWLVASPGIFLGVALSRIPCDAVMRKMFKKRYDDYFAQLNDKYGFNGGKVFRIFSQVWTILCLCLFVFLLSCVATIDAGQIHIRDIVNVRGRSYPLSSIAMIGHYQRWSYDNKLVIRPAYGVDFVDGWRWVVEDRDAGNFIELLSTKSGKAIEDKDVM